MYANTPGQNIVPFLGFYWAFSSCSGFKKVISLGTCPAHNTDPLDRPNEYKENGKLALGWLWFFQTGAHC